MTEDCRLQPVEQDSRLVYGQFAFAKGPLFILSASLVREILANRSVTAEANITIGVDEQRAKRRPDHKVWEDVFVGFAASMAAGPLGGPVTHLGLPFGNQYRESSRDWREPMTVSATAIVYHSIGSKVCPPLGHIPHSSPPAPPQGASGAGPGGAVYTPRANLRRWVATRRPTTASGARSSYLQSRPFHCLLNSALTKPLGTTSRTSPLRSST